MTRILKFKRYPNATVANTIGANGELIIDTTSGTLTVHNGVTAGGTRQATESYVDDAISEISIGSSTYSNTNVASFLQSYGGTVAASNIHGVDADGQLLLNGGPTIESFAYLNLPSDENANNWTARLGNDRGNAEIIANGKSWLFTNTDLYTDGINVISTISSAYTQANTPSYTANSGSLYANASFLQANAAFTQANNAAATIPQNSQSTSYTLALTDAGKHIYSTNSTTQIINLPNNGTISWPVGSTIMLVLRGSGTMNVVPATGISLYAANSSTSKSYANVYSYGMATLLNVAANTWFINGAGVS